MPSTVAATRRSTRARKQVERFSPADYPDEVDLKDDEVASDVEELQSSGDESEDVATQSDIEFVAGDDEVDMDSDADDDADEGDAEAEVSSQEEEEEDPISQDLASDSEEEDEDEDDDDEGDDDVMVLA